jgi:hypothetical protein
MSIQFRPNSGSECLVQVPDGNSFIPGLEINLPYPCLDAVRDVMRTIANSCSSLPKSRGIIQREKRSLQLFILERIFFGIIGSLVLPIVGSSDKKDPPIFSYQQALCRLEKQGITYLCPEQSPVDIVMLACSVGRCCSCMSFVAEEGFQDLGKKISVLYLRYPEHHDTLQSIKKLFYYAVVRQKIHSRINFITEICDIANASLKVNSDFPFTPMMKKARASLEEFRVKNKEFQKKIDTELEKQADSPDLLSRLTIENSALKSEFCSKLLACAKNYYEKELPSRIFEYASTYSKSERNIYLKREIRTKYSCTTRKEIEVWTRAFPPPEKFATAGIL